MTTGSPALTQGMHIGLAAMTDCDAIIHLETEAFTHGWSSQSWEQEIASHFVAVARSQDGDLIGVVAMSAVADSAELLRIIVAEPSRGTGVGTALLEYGLAWAKTQGTAAVFLEVSAGNDAAIGLYERSGFVYVDRRTDYYGAGDDALVYKLQIARSESAPEPEAGPEPESGPEPHTEDEPGAGSEPEIVDDQGDVSLPSVTVGVTDRAEEPHAQHEGGNMSEPLILGIESSCDETGVGIVRGHELLANEVASSVEAHVRFGGVVPEIASRAHLEAIALTLKRALERANVDLGEIDAIAVTAGPGLMGALVVGLSAAKALAYALDKPLYGVNHLIGHVGVDMLEHGPLPQPSMALLVSGGHTNILRVDNIATDVSEIGTTIDDAAGEAYDKVARLLGLAYPGGPVIDAEAAHGDPTAIAFPRGLTAKHDLEKHRFDFSFSGLKTAVARWVEIRRRDGLDIPIADVAASFQEAVADVLTAKTIDACQYYGIDSLLLGGGVAANSRLRELLAERCEKAGITLRRPRPGLCTDNGAMIAAVGSELVKAGVRPSSLDISADSGMPVSQISM